MFFEPLQLVWCDETTVINTRNVKLVNEGKGVLVAKRKHHFVPKLYLKAFESEPRRIQLYNLIASRYVENASLRNQCYRSKFYGQTDSVEDYLMKLEDFIAPVLRSIVTKDTIPPFGSEDFLLLLSFVAMQILRTPTSADRVNRIVDKTIKQAYSSEISTSDSDIEKMRFGFDDPVLMSLRFLPGHFGPAGALDCLAFRYFHNKRQSSVQVQPIL